MKKPMKCIGDADALIKLKLHKVNKEWISKNLRDCNKIISML